MTTSDPFNAAVAESEREAATRGAVLVEATRLRKMYVREGQPLEVLKGVTLTIRAGEVLGIVGPSGAGKSTLLHLLGTLDQPTSGTITINGVDVTKLSNPRVSALRNESIGFVFQFHHLLPEFSALENVMMPALIKGGAPRARLETEALRILSEVGLTDRARHRPSEMSGGEQQRVALARALMLRPPILMADEPTGNLDTENSERMHELFFQLNRKFGTTIVIVTHNEALAARVPRVVKMKDGYIVADEFNTPGAPLDPQRARVSAPGASAEGLAAASAAAGPPVDALPERAFDVPDGDAPGSNSGSGS